MVSKELLSEFANKYFEAEKLIKDNKCDPLKPFLSKFAARPILLQLFEEIRRVVETESHLDTDSARLIGMQAACQLTLAIISFETGEISYGENHLKICEDIVISHETSSECAGIVLVLFNEFGVYHHKLGSDKGLEYLSRAEVFYNNCKLSNVDPLLISELFSGEISGEGIKKFESSFTLTLYFLAQLYAQTNHLKSAIYCHRTLKRQLEAQDDTFDHIEWSLNAATLAQYFISKNCFKQARHHLSASSFVLQQFELKLNEVIYNKDASSKIEEFRHRSADVNRCWAKYCYCLLISSKDRLLADTPGDVFNTDISSMNFYENDETITLSETMSLYFAKYDLSSFECTVTDKYVSIYTQAKPIFLLALNFLNKAQDYYTLDKMASEYIEIAQEQSKLYSIALTFFEDNADNYAKLYKRAIDLLERVLTQVNPKYYLKYCQEIWYRLGQLHSNILDVKLEKHKTSLERPKASSLKKINMLIDKSIFYFVTYLDSLPAEVVENLIEPFLMCHFNIATLTRKYITYEKRAKHRNAKNSLKHLEIVLNYCKENEDATNLVTDYITIAKELVILLPIEISRIEKEIGPLD